MKEKRADRRTKVTKAMIRKAFTKLLAEKPIQKISVKELCDLADINRGTFYLHYTDIYDLLEKTEEEMLDDFQNALYPILDAEGEYITTKKITLSSFQCIKDNLDICVVTLGPHGDKKFAAKIIELGWYRCLETYQNLIPEQFGEKLEYYYSFISNGCLGVFEKWYNDGMKTSVDELAELIDGYMTIGVRAVIK